MITSIEKKIVSSNTGLEKLSNSEIQLIAEYSFQNPNSINGPFGSMLLTLSKNSDSNQNIAVGKIKINTLFGLGSTTILNYQSKSTFNPSTGYTNINTEGKGTISILPNPSKYIEAEITILLEPGLKNGTLSVEGFFSNFKVKATSVHFYNEND